MAAWLLAEADARQRAWSVREAQVKIAQQVDVWRSMVKTRAAARYPPAEAARNFKYEISRPDTRTLRSDDRYPQQVEVVDPRHLRITSGDSRTCTRT